MSAKYGGYIMIIKNIKSFAEKVKTAIGAQSWYVNEISYSDYKAYSVDTIISDLNGVSLIYQMSCLIYFMRFRKNQVYILNQHGSKMRKNCGYPLQCQGM